MVTQYLTITGVLHPDNRLELEPGFLVEEPHSAVEARDSQLVAELTDGTGQPLLRRRLPHGPPCTDGAAVAVQLVMAKVPFPKGTRAIRFLLDGVLVHTLDVPRTGPSVQLAWDPSQGTDSEQQVAWQGEHREGRPLWYLLSYSADDGRTWQPLSLPTTETEHPVDFRRLAGGSTCRIRVLATDGVNTTAAVSEPFERPTQPCYAMILAPEHDVTVGRDQPVRFQGQGYYLEERRGEVELLDWTSSVDGPLGRGAVVEVVGLAPGMHEITLPAGSEGRTGVASLTLRVD